MRHFPKSYCTPLLLFFFFLGCREEKTESISLEVKFPENGEVEIPVVMEVKQGLEKDIALMKNMDGEQTEIPVQLHNGKIWFLASPERTTSGKVSYSIKKAGKTTENKLLSAIRRDGNFQLRLDGKPVIGYRYEMTYPPTGVDSIFRKSGFVHPILTPKGDTLTRIQPPDHYHHYGLWGPWTHTRIDTTRVDFWNLGEGMGTVLFKEFKDTASGDVFSSFTAAQEHIDLKTEAAPRIALNEDLHVRLWNLGRPDRYMFDYTTTFNSPLKKGILFEAYRYGGGIGLRFNERWKADNCSVMTSEGNDRLTADGTNARWCIVTGEASDGQGTNGVLFMSHPKNRAHPEPMRIWPIDANEGRGDMFFEFCPIRHLAWKIEPNKEYVLNYRMVVFEGTLKAKEAEAYWQAFAYPPEVKINL